MAKLGVTKQPESKPPEPERHSRPADTPTIGTPREHNFQLLAVKDPPPNLELLKSQLGPGRQGPAPPVGNLFIRAPSQATPDYLGRALFSDAEIRGYSQYKMDMSGTTKSDAHPISQAAAELSPDPDVNSWPPGEMVTISLYSIILNNYSGRRNVL